MEVYITGTKMVDLTPISFPAIFYDGAADPNLLTQQEIFRYCVNSNPDRYVSRDLFLTSIDGYYQTTKGYYTYLKADGDTTTGNFISGNYFPDTLYGVYYGDPFSNDGFSFGSIFDEWGYSVIGSVWSNSYPLALSLTLDNRFTAQGKSGIIANSDKFYFVAYELKSATGIYVICYDESSNTYVVWGGLQSSGWSSDIVTLDNRYPIYKNVVNFYRSSSPGVIDSSPIELSLGESSSQLEYTIVYEDGSHEAYNGEITYTGAHLGRAYTITDNVITVSDKTSLLGEIITARPSEYIDAEEYPNIFTFISLVITNPTGIYDDGDSDPLSPGLGPGGSGGGGYFGKNPTTGQPETSDPITIPNGSVAGDASATGMMTRYLANSSQLEIFGDWLWTDDLGLAIAKAGISLLYGSPAEAVISLMSYPFDISSLSGVTTRSQNLYWGNHNSGIGATALTSPAATIDWGTISLNEYWGNFLDYEPHTKIELYLPWGTGFVSIDPGQCLPGTLRVVTNIDLNKGSCIHNVFGNNGCVIGTYAGQCSQQIPIISNDYASKIAGVVTAGVSLAIGGVSGIGAGKSAENARLDYEMNVPLPAMNNMRAMQNYYMGMEEYASAVSKSTNRGRTASNLASIGSVAAARHSGIVARNGSFTDGSAALGCQYPYIILSRPSQSVPKEYGSHYGYPSNIFTQLSNLRGYTEVGEIHLNGIDATEPEIVELDKILKGGVIF